MYTCVYLLHSLILLLTTKLICFQPSECSIFRSCCRNDALFKLVHRNKVLTGGNTTVNTASTLPLCSKACMDDMKCLSFNYMSHNETMSLNTCEVLNVTKSSNGTIFVDKLGWKHYEPVIQMGPRCRNKPCQAGYTCLESCNNTKGFQCVDIDECSSSPCQNNGTCIDKVNSYNCTCKIGYQGIHCEIDVCSGLAIKSVGFPITNSTHGKTQGVWMKDPLEFLGPDKIWIMDGYYNTKTVQEYANNTNFIAGILSKTHQLPYAWDGTGAVVYGPFLYYNKASSNSIVKYDLRTSQMVTQRIHTYSDQGRSSYYEWGGHSGMDLAVDESGLWVLSGYSGYGGRLAAAMINTTSLLTTYVWNVGGEVQKSMGNAFVACGVVYMVDSYSGSTKINRAYDTKTRRSWNPDISFKWQFNYGSSLDYNPKEKRLYAWDNSHQVTYELTFGERV